MEKAALFVSQDVPSFSALLHQSREFYKQKFWLLLTVYAMPVLSVSLYVPVVDRLLNSVEAASKLLLLFLFVLGVGLLFVSALGYIALLVAIFEKGKIGLRESYAKGLRVFLPLFWVNTLVGVRTMAGFILLIIPGIYMTVQFIFAPFVFIDENKRGMKALHASASYVKGKWWKLFWRVLPLWIFSLSVGSIINIVLKDPLLASSVNSVINLFFVPFSIVYLFQLYQSLKSSENK